MTAPALKARHRERVFLRDEILERGCAPGRRQSGDVIGFLDRHGHAEQWPALAARQGRIRLPRRFPGAREVAHRHGVEIAIKSLNPGDELVGQFKRRDLLLQQGLRQFAGAAIGPLRGGMRRKFCHAQCPCLKLIQKDCSTSSECSQKSPCSANPVPSCPAPPCSKVYGQCAHAL
jgi:hypothetical protein